jgi:hypothetical protein
MPERCWLANPPGSWLKQTVANGVPTRRGHSVYGTGLGEPRDRLIRKRIKRLVGLNIRKWMWRKRKAPRHPSLPPQLRSGVQSQANSRLTPLPDKWVPVPKLPVIRPTRAYALRVAERGVSSAGVCSPALLNIGSRRPQDYPSAWWPPNRAAMESLC